MDAQTFWNVIGIYNQQTVAVQIVLFLFAVITAVLSYSHKVKWAAKFALGIIHLFIGIAFFAWHGVEPIQKYFALPLYLLCGFLFLYESWHNRNDILEKPNGIMMLRQSNMIVFFRRDIFGVFPFPCDFACMSILFVKTKKAAAR